MPKGHPRLLNPAQTIKIIPSKINDIKEIKEEAIEESIETSQIKKPNLKLIIPDNSNDEMEPSTSGSKLSQNTPSNSPLVYIEKNKNKENGKFFSLNKNDDNIIIDEEIFKETPHFTGDNKASCESAKEDLANNLKLLQNPCSPIDKNLQMPLTGNNKGYTGYKFTFNFETKENGSIVPKFNKEDKKIIRIANQFRLAKNKNGNMTKNKNKFINKQDSSHKIYSTKDVKCKPKEKEKDYSPINTSINSIKITNQESDELHPIQNRQNRFNIKENNKILNKNFNTEINNKRCKIFDTKKRIRTSRPKSGKNISPKKQNSSKNRILNLDKIKKERKTHCISSNKRTTILPYLTENRQIIVKSKLENEVSNLFKMLPDNYYEDPEINNHMNLLIHNIAEIKECINKNKFPFKNSDKTINAKNKK